MTANMPANPYPAGGADAAEWARIAAAPASHGRLALDPSAPVPEPDPRLEDADVLAAHAHALAVLADPAPGTESTSPRQLPAGGVLFGPDCSQYQGQPDWGTVRASGCVIGGYKVSEGRTFQDPTHQWNRSRVPGNGLVPLAYHYLYYSDEYAANPALWGKQADWFASLVDPAALHCLDVEAPATAGHHLGVKEWVAEYRKLFPGHALGCYTNKALWQNRSRMPYDPAGLFDWVWHAGVGNGYYTTATGTIAQQWAATGGLSNSVAGIGYPTVRFWQITDHAKVPGVGGSFCDGNAFQGTLDQLKALATGEDDMPLTDAEMKKVAAAVWDHLVDSEWNGKPAEAGSMLASAQRYAIEGGYPFNRPTGNAYPNTATHAKILADALKVITGQTDTLEASDAAQSAALAQVSPGVLADALAAKLRDGGVQVQGVDYARIRQLLGEGLHEHLASLRIVTDTGTPPQ